MATHSRTAYIDGEGFWSGDSRPSHVRATMPPPVGPLAGGGSHLRGRRRVVRTGQVSPRAPSPPTLPRVVHTPGRVRSEWATTLRLSLSVSFRARVDFPDSQALSAGVRSPDLPL